MAEDKTPKWKDTLNLPRTGFPMKAQLKKKEPQILQKWLDMDIYQKILDARKGSPLFILHDGPPYANGHIHLGHALNKILKDFIIRVRNMQGYSSPFIPGWDCHGLPIEHQVDQELNEKKASLSTPDFRLRCREYALKYLNMQREGFIRLGLLGDWENPFMTLQHDYEAGIIEYFKSFVEKGNVYRRKRPVYWCTHCRTALAEAEVEYHNHESHSITVSFPIPDPPDFLKPHAGSGLSILIWTTTPWTIPANLAVAVHPDFEYAVFEMEGKRYIAATRLIPLIAESRAAEHRIIFKFTGHQLEGAKARHPLFDRDSLIITADYVGLDQGTGCVHTAPGHGDEDYKSGIKHGLEIYSPVMDDGMFDETTGPYAGLHVNEVNKAVIRDLEAGGYLLQNEDYPHSYPHCWRCRNPLIFRATAQWFISMDTADLREKAMSAAREVNWLPEWGRERMLQMLENRPDWCISRQREWGVPIPVFFCESCNEALLDIPTIDNVRELFAKSGSDSWYTTDSNEIIPKGTRCAACGSEKFRKGKDILDVWFESGSSISVLENRPGHQFPSDVYLEGGDQFRGWYHSALLVGISAREKSPYRTVITHGWALDHKGRAMSKSLGNGILPQEIVESHGAEILRLWVSMANYREDIRLGDEILSRVTEGYRKIRNTWRFMLGVLNDFNPVSHPLDNVSLRETDLFILARFEELKEKVLAAYDNFDTHVVFHAMTNFFTVDLSSFYLNFNKDNLYCNETDSQDRRATQATIFHILMDSAILMAPILSFTSEEVWEHIPDFPEREASVHLTLFPSIRKELRGQVNGRRWERLMEAREIALKEIEETRRKGEIGDSMEASLRITLPGDWMDDCKDSGELLAEILVVAKVEVLFGDSLTVEVTPFSGSKCPRCWKRFSDPVEGRSHPELCARCHQVMEKVHE